MRVGAGRLQPVMECHIYSHFVMVAAAKGFLAGGEGEGRVDDGHGRGSFVRLVFIQCSGPASERPFIARICVRARARVSAGAVRAPDCAHARQMQDAPSLSAESGSVRTGPARAGRGSGCRFPRTHHSTFSENASFAEKYNLNLTNFSRTFSDGSTFPVRIESLPRSPSVLAPGTGKPVPCYSSPSSPSSAARRGGSASPSAAKSGGRSAGASSPRR